MTSMADPRAVVLVSGGLDSATALAIPWSNTPTFVARRSVALPAESSLDVESCAAGTAAASGTSMPSAFSRARSAASRTGESDCPRLSAFPAGIVCHPPFATTSRKRAISFCSATYPESAGRIAIIALSRGICVSVRASALSTFSSRTSMCQLWPTVFGLT